MASSKRELNEDRLCGHKFFDSALQLSVLAKDKQRVVANELPDWEEARRLYEAAITDTKVAIQDVEADESWRKDARELLIYMKGKISEWEGELYTMPKKNKPKRSQKDAEDK